MFLFWAISRWGTNAPHREQSSRHTFRIYGKLALSCSASHSHCKHLRDNNPIVERIWKSFDWFVVSACLRLPFSTMNLPLKWERNLGVSCCWWVRTTSSFSPNNAETQQQGTLIWIFDIYRLSLMESNRRCIRKLLWPGVMEPTSWTQRENKT